MRLRAKHLVAAITAFSVALPPFVLPSAAAPANERTLSFYHIHTQETLTVLYKRDGKFIPEAMKKIDWIMRDWRKNQETVIDPDTVDIIWEMHTELGSKEPVHIICGYRSRGTNEMLRKTRGGQASQSQHITGKAIDITFPDIPVHQLRYSAMIRERGGVGYYPTSGIPFVHVDTSRVRHWPRMVRDELALLFPSGHSKHEPADGRPITPRDVANARSRNKDLVQKVAAFYDLRSAPKTPVLVAAAAPEPQAAAVPAPKPVTRPERELPVKMAVGAPAPEPDEIQREALPKLVAAPRPVERPSRFVKAPSDADKKKLDELVTLAAFSPPEPKLVAPPVLAKRPEAKPPAAPPATLAMEADAHSKPADAGVVAMADDGIDGAGRSDKLVMATNWSAGPEYDEDHPEELSYRPFPLAPLLTASASPDDPALAQMVHPDVGRTLDLIDDVGGILPMKLRPGRQVAQLMWAHEFRGEAVAIGELEAREPERAKPQGLAARAVKTVAR